MSGADGSSREYARPEMPALKSLLADWRREGLSCRVHIRSGAPRFWYGNRQLRRVHANLVLRSGIERSRSKSLTDGVLELPVARWSFGQGRKTALVHVFAPYGRKKHRPDEKDGQEPTFWPDTVPGHCSDLDDDDELPFN